LGLKDYFLVKFEALHGALRDNTADLTYRQWHEVPGGHPRANTIAWNMWHFHWNEDSIVHALLLKRSPLWADGWAERLKLKPFVPGQTISTEEAQSLRIEDPELFCRYMEAVWEATERYIAEADESSWEELISVTGRTMRVYTLLGQIAGSHGYRHIGELDLARTFLGLPWQPGWEWEPNVGR
jgi:hypothetical protein